MTTTPPRVTQDMTAMIYRMLAFYSLVGLLPNLPQSIAQLPGTDRWAAVVFVGGICASAATMIVLALARRSLRMVAGVYAAFTIAFVFSAPWVMGPTTSTDDVWIFGGIGTSIVCAGIALGGRVAVCYAVFLALGYTSLRSSPPGGSVPLLYALCSGVFASIGGLSILAVALGMIAAANAADNLARRVQQRELDHALDRAVNAERARLDQLIHDDVLTTLAAAAHASDPKSVRATAELAGLTLSKIEELRRSAETSGALSCAVFVRLAAQTALRVSPEVVFHDESSRTPATARLPTAAAEAMLSSMREAVRNAVRHARAQRVQVDYALTRTADGSDCITLAVTDDGQGFEPTEVPADRLGIRLSMTESLRTVGASCVLRSAPGLGTRFEITRACEKEADEQEQVHHKPREPPMLPADFPVRRLILVMWGVVVGEIGIGLANLGRLDDELSIAAMVILCPLVALVMHTGRDLRLPIRSAAVSVVLIAAVTGLTGLAAPTDRLPDIAMWQQFPVQLVLVALIIRRRPFFAAVGLLAVWVANSAWAANSLFGWGWFLAASFGATSFVIMAVLVSRVLQSIARRQHRLQQQERAAIDASVRRHVALVQRALWISDLKAEARDTLITISQLVDLVPDEMQSKALLVEATLREALSARNMMNEELAGLTEAARRRGVSITFVDSRTTPVSNEVGRAVMAEIREKLNAAGVSRLVVRLAPDKGDLAASVVTENSSRTNLTFINPAGARESKVLPRHE